VNLHSHFDCVNLSAVLEPKQERSRLTLKLLLNAAESLLNEKGLAATTVPAIAKRAGLSVGVVYRRFPNKDALLRAVYQRFFWEMREQNRLRLETSALLTTRLEPLARSVIAGMVEGYRRKTGILRALTQYARTHRDKRFRRAAQEMNREAMASIAALFLSHQHRIRHPHPAQAIEFALLSMASILRIVILEEEPLHEVDTPENLAEELTRMFLGYLGVAE
jgi:AcrR family transcriptional regulator